MSFAFVSYILATGYNYDNCIIYNICFFIFLFLFLSFPFINALFPESQHKTVGSDNLFIINTLLC